MKIVLSYNNEKPMYEQIKDAIKSAIYSGQLKDKDVLPSMRQLAKELDVSMITTKRAYVDLEYEGFVYTISGKGTFVKLHDLDRVLDTRRQKLLSELEIKLQQCYEAEMPKDIVIKSVDKIYGGNNDE